MLAVFYQKNVYTDIIKIDLYIQYIIIIFYSLINKMYLLNDDSKDIDFTYLLYKQTNHICICDVRHQIKLFLHIHTKVPLHEIKPITNISDIKLCADFLTSVIMVGLDIKSVKDITKLYKLEKICFDSLNKIKSIKLLKKIRTLKDIKVEKCNMLKDVSCILSKKCLYGSNKNRFIHTIHYYYNLQKNEFVVYI